MNDCLWKYCKELCALLSARLNAVYILSFLRSLKFAKFNLGEISEIISRMSLPQLLAEKESGLCYGRSRGQQSLTSIRERSGSTATEIV